MASVQKVDSIFVSKRVFAWHERPINTSLWGPHLLLNIPLGQPILHNVIDVSLILFRDPLILTIFLLRVILLLLLICQSDLLRIILSHIVLVIYEDLATIWVLIRGFIHLLKWRRLGHKFRVPGNLILALIFPFRISFLLLFRELLRDHRVIVPIWE